MVGRRVVIPVEEFERNVFEPLLDQPSRGIQSDVTPVSPAPEKADGLPVETLRTRIRLDRINNPPLLRDGVFHFQ